MLCLWQGVYICDIICVDDKLILIICFYFRYAYTGERSVESNRTHYHRGSSSVGERVPLLKDSPAVNKPTSLCERRNSLFTAFEEGWLSVFDQMNLPSFDRQFLQLACVPLDVMHVCIRKNLNLHCQNNCNLSILSRKAVSTTSIYYAYL